MDEDARLSSQNRGFGDRSHQRPERLFLGGFIKRSVETHHRRLNSHRKTKIITIIYVRTPSYTDKSLPELGHFERALDLFYGISLFH